MSESKGWAMGTPSVLYMVGIACIMLYALLSNRVNPGAIPIVGLYFLAGGVGCLVIGSHELKRGDILLGSIDTVFAVAIFWGVGLVFTYMAWSWANLAAAPAILQPDLKMASMLAAGIALTLLLFLPSVGKVAWSLFLFFIVLAAAAACTSWGLWQGTAFGDFPLNVAAILFLLFGLFVFYAATVFITNTVYQAPKLPIGAPLFK